MGLFSRSKAPQVKNTPPSYPTFEKGEQVRASFQTNRGSFTAELFAEACPVTVGNFVGLATGEIAWTDPSSNSPVQRPFYDGLSFHRIIPGFVIQGGCPLGNGRGGPGYSFDDEIVPALKHDKAGILSMANAGPNTNGSQFFVTDAATPHLDGRHSVFGQVTEGLDVVHAIAQSPTDAQDRPLEPVIIEQLVIQRT